MGVAVDFDGCQNLKSASTPALRWFWIITVALNIAAGIYWSYLNIDGYVTKPTTSNIEVIHLTQMDIPDIQICSKSILNVTKLLQSGASVDLISMLNFYFVFQTYYRYARIPGDTMKAIDMLARRIHDEETNTELTELLRARNQTFDKFIMDHGIDCEQMLLECRIAWKTFDCCKFAKPVENERFGKCYAMVDLHRIGLQLLPGESNGLQVLINPSTENWKLRKEHKIFGNVIRGASVEIAENFGHPSQVTFKVSGGMANYFNLKAIQYKRLPESNAGCTEPTDDSLTTNGCMVAYRERALADLCKCKAFGHKLKGFNVINFPVCTPEQAIRCVAAAARLWKINDYFYELVHKHCSKPLCFEWTYDIGEMKADLELSTIRRLRPQDNPETIRTYAQLTIYHGDMAYTRITEVQKSTFYTVASAIGGDIGLFIGGSFVTVVQLLLIAFNRVRRKRTAVSPHEKSHAVRIRTIKSQGLFASLSK